MHYHFGYPFNPTRAVLPSPPQNLRVTASSDTSITLEWDASTEGDFPISNYKLIADNLVIATPVGTSFIYDAVPPNESVAYRVQAVDSDGNAGPWSSTLTYTNVVDSDDAPIYLMTEPLVNDGSFDYLFNSALSGTKWDAKLLTSTDTAWNPDSAQYPEDGTIDFSGGNKADTGWIAPQDTEWTMSGIYNVVMGVSYDMYSIHYKTGNLCDIYLGSNTEDLTLSESDKDYTPPTEPWVIEEEPPAIIFPEGNIYESYVSFVLDNPSGIDNPATGEIILETNTRDAGVTTQLYDATGAILTGVTIEFDQTLDRLGTVINVTGDDSGFLFDKQFNQAFYSTTAGENPTVMTIRGLDTSGIYTVRVSGSRVGDTSLVQSVTIGGVENTYDIADNMYDGSEHAGLSPNGLGEIIVTLGTTSSYLWINGLDLIRTA